MLHAASRSTVVRPRRPMRCAYRAALVALAALAVAGCGLADVTAEERGTLETALTPGGSVEVETWNGGIEIRGCPGAKVQISFVKRGAGASKDDAQADIKNLEVVVEEKPTGVKIVGRRKDAKSSGASGVSFVLCVPRATPIGATTSNGAVSVTDVGAAVTAVSLNGAVTAKDTVGAVKLTSKNGSLTATGKDALLALSTSNGSVSYAGSLASGDHSLRTNNGSIDVALPAGALLALTATTSNGSVTCELPLEGPGERSRKHVEGVTGPNATSIVTVSTSNGSVHVHEQR